MKKVNFLKNKIPIQQFIFPVLGFLTGAYFLISFFSENFFSYEEVLIRSLLVLLVFLYAALKSFLSKSKKERLEIFADLFSYFLGFVVGIILFYVIHLMIISFLFVKPWVLEVFSSIKENLFQVIIAIGFLIPILVFWILSGKEEKKKKKGVDTKRFSKKMSHRLEEGDFLDEVSRDIDGEFQTSYKQ